MTPTSSSGLARRRLPPMAGRRGVSRRLLDLGRAVRSGQAKTLGDAMDGLGNDAIALALLLLTLPTLIPVPGPIGMTFGTLLALLAVQLMLGSRTLWLPGWARRRPLPAKALRAPIARSLPWIGRAESLLRERRLSAFAGQRARAVLAAPLLLLAVAIILPIPLGNLLPAIALMVFALGFLTRDGGAVLAALVISVLALAWIALVLIAGAEVLERLLQVLGLGSSS